MTNADLAAVDDSDLVVVIAPSCVQPSPDADDRAEVVPAQVTLDGEAAVLIANDKRVLVLRPSAALQRLMGRNPLAMKRCPEITAAAFDEATELLAAR